MATKTILEGSNVADLYKRFEQKGFFMRLDPDIEPTRMRGATVTKAEMAKIRMVEKVVRKGRIKKLQERKVIFVKGEVMESQRRRNGMGGQSPTNPISLERDNSPTPLRPFWVQRGLETVILPDCLSSGSLVCDNIHIV